LTTTTFEDPRKTDLRERVAIALDAAGYEVVVEPEPIQMPGEELQGAIVGDIQSVDADGARTVYCLRVSSARPIPQWLANWSRATLEIDGVSLYVVVDEEPSAELDRSCRAAGAGLLILRSDGLEAVIKAGEIPAELRDRQCAERVTDLRRKMETRLRLQLDAIQSNYTSAQELTATFPDDVQDDYMSDIESHADRWRRWAEDISQALDSVASTCDEEEFELIEEMLERGAG
jgi:hypothetical protein